MRHYYHTSGEIQMRPVMGHGGRRVDGGYFDWLLDIVDIPPDPYHETVAKILFETEFFWVLNNDENRVFDAIELMVQYADIVHGVQDSRRYIQGEDRLQSISYYAAFDHDGAVSVLEVLIALAKRMDYQLSEGAGDPTRTHIYFWELLANLWVRDGALPDADVLHRWMSRAFEPDGSGSTFPLEKPQRNQRECELWEQMSDYLHEKYLGR